MYCVNLGSTINWPKIHKRTKSVPELRFKVLHNQAFVWNVRVAYEKCLFGVEIRVGSAQKMQKFEIGPNYK